MANLIYIFLFIFFSSNLLEYILCFVLPVPQRDVQFNIVGKLITTTFNGYDCLNILISNDTSSDNQLNILYIIHKLDISIRFINSLQNAIHYCGFLVISNGNSELLYDFSNVKYEDVIRVLYIDFLFDDALQQLQTDEISLHDMDLALVNLTSLNDTPTIFIKSRYENETHTTDGNFSKPFFHDRRIVPTVVNYNKKNVRVIAFDCPIFSIVANDELIDGIEVRIYREFERKMNFTTTFMLPLDGKRWGLAFPNGTVTGGILKALYDRDADIGFCAFWMEHSKLWVSVLSHPWEFECLQFLIPKPKLIPPHWDNILKPLPHTLWILVLLSTIITSTACNILRYVERQLIQATLQGGNLTSEFMTVIGIFLLAKNPEKNHGRSVNRHVFMWWSVFALVITTLYSSSLVSHLTYPQFEPMIKTVEGLVKAGYYWGTDYIIPMHRFLDWDNPWHATFMNRYRSEANKAERANHLLDGNYSLLVKIVGDRHFMEVDDIPIDMLRQLRTSRNCVFYFYLSLVYRKAFPLIPVADQIIRQLIESGIIKYWLNRMFEPKYPSTTFTRVYEYKTPPDEIELTSLGLQNLQGAFLILIIGIVLACVVLAVELLRKPRQKMPTKRPMRNASHGTNKVSLRL